MKTFYSLLVLTFWTVFAVAQNTVPRTPLYEVFSSSTCGPCKPGNDHLTPLFEEQDEAIAVIKYQMNWPGYGDPYFTSEGYSRRGTYGVSSIPAFFRNAAEQPYSSFTAASIEEDLQEESNMEMYLRYMIDAENQSITINAYSEALADYTAGAHRFYVAIIEKVTYNNVESNGETEFHNVFKKMLPESNGEIIIGTIETGNVIEYETTYVFQGDYRLPVNSDDEINNDIEHSVEDFENLHAVMFMQSLSSDKAIYQAVRGERVTTTEDLEREWGTPPAPPLSIKEFNAGKQLAVYPNPAQDFMNIEFVNTMENAHVKVMDITGNVVKQESQVFIDNRTAIDVSGFSAGVYLLHVSDGQQEYYHKFSVLK